MTIAVSVPTPELCGAALDRGMELVLAAPSALSAFVMTERDGERELHEFTTDKAGQSAAAARYFLRASVGLERAVIVWDGYVMSIDRRVDAVLAEYSEAGAESSRILARRYRPASLLRRAVALPGTVAVGDGHPLF